MSCMSWATLEFFFSFPRFGQCRSSLLERAMCWDDSTEKSGTDLERWQMPLLSFRLYSWILWVGGRVEKKKGAGGVEWQNPKQNPEEACCKREKVSDTIRYGRSRRQDESDSLRLRSNSIPSNHETIHIDHDGMWRCVRCETIDSKSHRISSNGDTIPSNDDTTRFTQATIQLTCGRFRHYSLQLQRDSLKWRYNPLKSQRDTTYGDDHTDTTHANSGTIMILSNCDMTRLTQMTLQSFYNWLGNIFFQLRCMMIAKLFFSNGKRFPFMIRYDSLRFRYNLLHLRCE